MRITTEQLKSLMSCETPVVGVRKLCRYGGLNYNAIRMRLAYGSSLTEDEELALGRGLKVFLWARLGWRVEKA